MSVSSTDLEQSGWALLPLSKTNKRPTRSYRNDPVREVTQEALLLEKMGGRVGLRLGKYIALDIDSAFSHKEANLNDGLKFVKWLKDNGWFDPHEDMWQKTAGGGYHILYKVPRDVLRNEHINNSWIIKGIDIKAGNTSFVVNHGNFNKTHARELPIGLYQWLRQHMFITSEKPKIITRPRPSEVPEQDSESDLASAQWLVENAREGERNQTLAKQTWRLLFHSELESTLVKEAMLASAQTAGLDVEEATATINHAIRKMEENM